WPLWRPFCRRSMISSRVTVISGIRIRSAPPARPPIRATQPVSRPITSTTITRWWEAAVGWSRSSASATRPPGVRQPGGHREGVVAADGDQGIQLSPTEVAEDLLAATLALHRVGPGASQHGASELEDAREEAAVQLHEVTVADQAGPAVLDTNDSITVGEGTPPHPADRRVEP